MSPPTRRSKGDGPGTGVAVKIQSIRLSAKFVSKIHEVLENDERVNAEEDRLIGFHYSGVSQFHQPPRPVLCAPRFIGRLQQPALHPPDGPVVGATS